MSEKNNGGPAFPTNGDPMAKAQAEGCGMRYLPPQGMTLRDYFAAKALVGLLSCPKTINGADVISASDYSIMSFEMADAMLKARDAQ